MTDRIEQVASDLAQTAKDVKATFTPLTVEQLNWKPAGKSWSVAQCLDHLMTTHGLFFPLLARLHNGGVAPTFWERNSPFSSFFGRFLIKRLDPACQPKMKTTAKGQPSASEIDGGIIERYCEHQHELIGHFRGLPPDLDLKKTILTSPLLAAITYSLDDWMTIAVIHGQRHHLQAKRVAESDNFPRS
jgi:hypothetical protein